MSKLLDSLVTAVPVMRQEKVVVREARSYEAVWLQLRKRGKITVSVVDPVFVPRIKRMISKEKDMDVGFKIMNELARIRVRFEYDPQRKQLRAMLVDKYGIAEIRS